MATIALTSGATREERLFAGLAIGMAAVIIAGFSTQFFAGRSSFGSPLVVHMHAVTFMTWIALFATQSTLVARNSMALHRTLGWIAGGWTIVMVIMGCVISTRAVRYGLVPPFFQPQRFMIINPLTVVTFAGLTWTAIAMRKRTDWHRRLHVCAMATIMGPGFGRLLPMPLMIPWSFEIAWGCGLIFPVIGMAFDLRRRGSVHPAWFTGLAVIVGMFVFSELLAVSPVADALYPVVTNGAPGATHAPLAYAAKSPL
jgi:hypothetical protein